MSTIPFGEGFDCNQLGGGFGRGRFGLENGKKVGFVRVMKGLVVCGNTGVVDWGWRTDHHGQVIFLFFLGNNWDVTGHGWKFG